MKRGAIRAPILEAFSLRSLRGRMALLLSAAMLPMAVITVDAGLRAAAAKELERQDGLAREVRDGLQDRAQDFSRLRTVSAVLAASAASLRPGSKACADATAELHDGFPDLSGVALVDADGRTLCTTGAQVADAAASLTAAADRADAPVVGYVEQGNDAPVIVSVAPVPGRDRVYAAVARPAGPLLDARLAEVRFAVLARTDGRLLAMRGLQAETPMAQALARSLAARPGAGDREPFRVAGLWVVAEALQGSDLVLVEGWSPSPPTFAGILAMVWAFGAPLLAWLVALAGAWFLVERYIVRPLTEIEAAARGFARGEEAPTAAHTDAPEEIRSLRTTLAAMARTLRMREHRLADALQEERALLREVHHRVNNNLQLVASLLSIQARAAESEQQALGLARAQERIHILAAAHNHIYDSGHIRTVRLDEMAGDIARRLIAARGGVGPQLFLDTTAVQAPVDRAVPLAFLIGESIARTLDLMDGRGDALEVSVRPEEGGVAIAVCGRPPAPSSTFHDDRIVEAFARQTGVAVDFDPENPLRVEMRAPAAALALVP